MKIGLACLCMLFQYTGSISVLFSMFRRYKLHKMHVREQTMYLSNETLPWITPLNQKNELSAVYNILFTII